MLTCLLDLLTTFLSVTARASLTPIQQVAFTCYGAQSKRQRRLLHKALGAPTIPSYYPFLLTETRSFLRRLIVSPSSYSRHIRRYAGGLTLSVIYGYEVVRDGPADDVRDVATDPSSKSGASSMVPDVGIDGVPKPPPEVDDMLALAEECVGILSNRIASGGGIWAVDVFPSLQRLPAWLPGMGWKTDSAKWKKRMEEFVERPYEYVKMSMVCLSRLDFPRRHKITFTCRNLEITSHLSVLPFLRTPAFTAATVKNSSLT